jgi:Lar family restriction alleviation protein
MKKTKRPKQDYWAEDLLPCPFCGRESPMLWDHITLDGSHVYYMECERCLARGPRSLVRAKAINAWNKRTKV